uniref:Uncharacterized protein n=1 Tax=Xiphophorus couchianus TaxID=32473 RepID=A0A3B5LVF8_9TELE
MGALPGLSPSYRPRGDRRRRAALLLPVVAAALQLCVAFNLDAEGRSVFTGKRGSYFGYSVEFFGNSSSVLIGAPKANTSQPNVTEGGAVYRCSWSQNNCSVINFDQQAKMVSNRWSQPAFYPIRLHSFDHVTPLHWVTVNA